MIGIFNAIMDIKIVSLVWTLSVITTTTFGLSPPQNVNIIIKDNNVTFTWTLPSEVVTHTYLDVVNVTSGNIVTYKYVEAPKNSYTTSDLTRCQQYTVSVTSILSSPKTQSTYVEKMFWTTDKVLTADLNTNVNLTWTTSLNGFINIMTPSGTMYIVLEEYETQLSDKNHLKINIVANSIHFTVMNITQNDGGIYKSEVDECCVLIVTDKPSKPQLTIDKHLFVGFPTVFTCRSEVQRWPADPAARLFYTFPAIGEQHNNTLTINVTKSDKGNKIFCLAKDDLGKTSEYSDVINVDPYYGPDNVFISPGINVDAIEGENLQPITCSADCNPTCTYVWKFNRTTKFRHFSDGQNLKIDNVTKMSGGVYRCRVNHANKSIRPTYPNGRNRYIRIDVVINVLYKPQQPFNVSVEVFSNKANITWITGFDGGFDQSFSIKYKKQNKKLHFFKTILLNGTGIKKDTALSYMVTGLAPRTSYIISVIATNSIGSRNKLIDFTTDAAPVPVNKSGGSVIVIACASVGGVLFFIIIFLGFLYHRSRRNSNSVAAQETDNERYTVPDRSDIQTDNYTELATSATDTASNDVIDDRVYSEVPIAIHVNVSKSDSRPADKYKTKTVVQHENVRNPDSRNAETLLAKYVNVGESATGNVDVDVDKCKKKNVVQHENIRNPDGRNANKCKNKIVVQYENVRNPDSQNEGEYVKMTTPVKYKYIGEYVEMMTPVKCENIEIGGQNLQCKPWRTKKI